MKRKRKGRGKRGKGFFENYQLTKNFCPPEKIFEKVAMAVLRNLDFRHLAWSPCFEPL